MALWFTGTPRMCVHLVFYLADRAQADPKSSVHEFQWHVWVPVSGPPMDVRSQSPLRPHPDEKMSISKKERI